MATTSESLLMRQSRRQRAVALVFGLSMVGLLASIFLTGGSPLFPGVTGPLLVLVCFLAAAGSVVGLAITRSRRAAEEAVHGN